jgi:TRAP-type transport system small permease protein
MAIDRHARGPLETVDRAVSGLVIVTMAVLVVIVSAQVILRYVFNSSLDWAWEASRLAFVTSIFLGIPLALKNRSHVGIDLIEALLPPTPMRALTIAMNLIVIVLMAVVTVVGFQAVLFTWDQEMSSIPISTGWFYVPVLWSGMHCVAHLVAHSIVLARGDDRPAAP